jgi:flagellar biosynthetic protein FliR
MEFMIEKLLGFVMVLTRISAFFLVAPVFSWKTIPARVKVSMVMLLTVFFSLITPFNINPKQVSMLEAILLLSNEALYGLAMGLITVIVFSAVRLFGVITERQMGLMLSSVLDPSTGQRGQPMGMFMEMIFILLFLSVNGHHLLLLIISRSYEAFPSGQIPTIPHLVEGVAQAGSAMLIAGLRLAAPILAAFLVLLVILGVFARIMPDMNILFISMPLRVGLGLLMAGMFLPFINGFISEFAELMGKLLPL